MSPLSSRLPRADACPGTDHVCHHPLQPPSRKRGRSSQDADLQHMRALALYYGHAASAVASEGYLVVEHRRRVKGGNVDRYFSGTGLGRQLRSWTDVAVALQVNSLTCHHELDVLTCCWLLAICCLLLDAGCLAGCWLLASCCWLLASCCWLLDAG